MKKTDRLYVSYTEDSTYYKTEDGTNFSVDHKKGRAALFCHGCGRMNYFKIYSKSKIITDNYVCWEMPTYVMDCKFCGRRIRSDNIIDGGIAEAIEILNKKGYKTSYSCEGHYDEKYGVSSLPYILFDPSMGDITKNFDGIGIYPWNVCVEKHMKQEEENGVITLYKNEFEYRTKLYVNKNIATPNVIKIGTYLDILLNIVDRLKAIN